MSTIQVIMTDEDGKVRSVTAQGAEYSLRMPRDTKVVGFRIDGTPEKKLTGKPQLYLSVIGDSIRWDDPDEDSAADFEKRLIDTIKRYVRDNGRGMVQTAFGRDSW